MSAAGNRAAGTAAARRRDRRVYLRSHPVLFALLAATRGRGVRRLGRTVLVHDAGAYRQALTRLPLDRTAAGTTGGAAREALAGAGAPGGGVLFDQEGSGHRAGRRGLAEGLGAAGVEELRALWRPLLERRLAPLADGGEVDLVALARELSGTVVCALLDSPADPAEVARACAGAASASIRAHLPGPPRPGARARAAETARTLRALLAPATPGSPADSPARAADTTPADTHPTPDGSAPVRGAKPGAHVTVPTPAQQPAGRAAGTAPDRTPPAPAEDANPAAHPTAAPPGQHAPGPAADTAADHTQPDPDALAPGLPGGVAGAGRQGCGRRGGGPDAAAAGPGWDGALAAMVAVAAVNTSVAAVPRAAAWCADAGLWGQAADPEVLPRLVDELLRVTAASPLLPRVAAADGRVGGCPVRSGDRLLLVARHAARAHRRDPDALDPAPAAEARLVFGAGPHACPGARLARAQLADVLAALAPYRPRVVRARVDRQAALPGWRVLTVRAAS
ncbi:cytochrome P450 [Streptomyces sp. NPDC046866]|uniref:cytochrome P450 n=1 Tax=Streptomyces sp. NPDC046866 TaxID=3154921 RepID=UPI0034562E38